MKNHEPSGKKPAGTKAPSRWRRGRFRRKVPSEVTVKGKLRMRSPSGAFVIVGVSVVLVGMIIAVIGYWPHRSLHGTRPRGRPGNSSATDEIKKEVKVSPHPLPHSEKLKLIGPVIMGIGLFIFICANTMLYENRDMETRLLMQRELYSMSLSLPQDASQASSYFQRRPTPSTLQANAECVEGCYEVDLSSSGFQSCSSPVKKWVNSCSSNRLQTAAQFLPHQSVSPSLSLLSVRSDAGNSVPGSLGLSFARGAESVISSAVNALSLPLIKLNNCLLESQGVSRVAVRDLDSHHARLPEEKEEILRLSWTVVPSALQRGELRDSHVVIDMETEPPSATSIERLLRPECTKRGFSSETQIPNSGHSKSLDLGCPGVVSVAPVKDRKHRSWPRLDHIGLINYAKLERGGESSDRLLEQSRELIRGGSGQASREVVIETGSTV
ncbi:transmembrane protein 200B isoform X2 [Hemicordylus capensis]|nr:transmembrane protein 200B isoform X2 [Hemicordylus capensis]XP_053124794.1 transmembrane protein 200B isoform X2 [Hemicordylus capensis]XP_053124795.1 transmembrane protein 200B isoform X2 [Hemicordylus capensis]XP_053124796.1 transmembrane protein 200B isoform X2 [Hemicordylus capensis]XP_053124797.1 transmembrane protein 200B isoform X2 [Hemicordylus capensis]XP_053124798.1 transmembrane protein 200B isoform X2 [Hemicordylus capensis]XP_053124799.1 transmembrane protein 200B isoform X2 